MTWSYKITTLLPPLICSVCFSHIIETTAHLLRTSTLLIFASAVSAPLKYDTYFSVPESNYECF